jgi:hypothetical protein
VDRVGGGQRVDFGLPQFPGYNADPPWAVCGYTGPQFRSAYHLSGRANGAVVTVAIVDAYASPTLLSDAHHFAARRRPSMSRPFTTPPAEPTSWSAPPATA